jgi:Secretion system C-terminal sorting domain
MLVRQLLLVALCAQPIYATAQAWQRYAAPPSNLAIYSCDTDGDTMLVYAPNGIWQSFNNGADWQLYEPYRPPAVRAWNKIEVERGIWFGINADQLVFYSFDKGESWQSVDAPDFNNQYHFIAVIGDRLFVYYNNQFHYTTDLGQNWTKVRGTPIPLFSEHKFATFKEEYFYQTEDALYRINKQDSIVKIPDPITNIGVRYDNITAGRDFLFVVYNGRDMIYSNDGFNTHTAILNKPFYFNYAPKNVRLIADPKSTFIALWATNFDGTWYNSNGVDAPWYKIDHTKNNFQYPVNAFIHNAHFTYFGERACHYELLSNNKFEGPRQNFSSNIIKKIIGTQKNIVAATSDGDIFQRSQKENSIWFDINEFNNYTRPQYFQFNYQYFFRKTFKGISIKDIDTGVEIQLESSSISVSTQLFSSNDVIYAVRPTLLGQFVISQMNDPLSALVNERKNQTLLSDAIFTEIDNGLVAHDPLVDKIMVYSEGKSLRVRDDLNCPGRELFAYDGRSIIKICDNEAFVLEEGSLNWRELRAQDWSTGTPLKFSYINHINYLNGRYWLGVDGKGLFYADDLSGAFYPYEVPLPENTPVAMSINYGKMWVAMRSGSIYSLALPSVTADNKNDFQLTLSPNPTPFGICYLNANLNVTTDVTLRIFDQQGRLVSESTQSGGDQWIIDAPALPQGMYWVQLSSNDVVETVRWVKGL